jgi:hypothetical protein
MTYARKQGSSVIDYEDPSPDQCGDDAHRVERKPSHAKLLLGAGLLGVVGAAFVLAAPELGLASVLGGTIAGIGSAGMTILARR